MGHGISTQPKLKKRSFCIFIRWERNRLPPNFDYAQYQAECMSEFLTELIELTPPVWAVVWSLTLLFTLVIIGAPEHSIAPPIIWVVLAYVETVFIFVLHQKCTSILKFLINAQD